MALTREHNKNILCVQQGKTAMTLLLTALVLIAFAIVYAQLALMVGSRFARLAGALTGGASQPAAGVSLSRAFIRA
jgi:hypothetical protein